MISSKNTNKAEIYIKIKVLKTWNHIWEDNLDIIRKEIK